MNGLYTASVESEPVSHDQDMIMSEAGTTESTTESHETSRVTSRASTPTEVYDSDPVALPMTPRLGDTVAASDDVPMMDISPRKEEQTFSLEESKTPKKRPSPPLEGLELATHGNVADGNHATKPHQTNIMGSHDILIDDET